MSLPNPIYRSEEYLNRIATGDGNIPDYPIYREEQYLDYIAKNFDNLRSRGRYLSLWDCETGLPVTDPASLPYTYQAGDYYRVSNVDDTTNYKPEGSSYTGAASDTPVGDTVVVDDTFIYDGTNWSLWKTGADLKNYYTAEQCDEKFIGKPQLLWTNPAPTSPFPAQSITITGLNKYKVLIVTVKRTYNRTNCYNNIILNIPSITATQKLNTDAASGSISTYNSREFNIANDTISISLATLSSGATDADGCIPIFIHGL